MAARASPAAAPLRRGKGLFAVAGGGADFWLVGDRSGTAVAGSGWSSWRVLGRCNCGGGRGIGAVTWRKALEWREHARRADAGAVRRSSPSRSRGGIAAPAGFGGRRGESAF